MLNATKDQSRGSSLNVRPARTSDYLTIRRLHQITHEEHVEREPDFADIDPFIDPYLRAIASPARRLWDSLFGMKTAVLVAERAGHVAGHLAYTIYSRGLKPYAAVIADISVAPEHRRAGIGTALLVEMEARETFRGLNAIAATIWPNNSASLALFQNAGYTPPTGITPTDEAQVLVEKRLSAEP